MEAGAFVLPVFLIVRFGEPALQKQGQAGTLSNSISRTSAGPVALGKKTQNQAIGNRECWIELLSSFSIYTSLSLLLSTPFLTLFSNFQTRIHTLFFSHTLLLQSLNFITRVKMQISPLLSVLAVLAPVLAGQSPRELNHAQMARTYGHDGLSSEKCYGSPVAPWKSGW